MDLTLQSHDSGSENRMTPKKKMNRLHIDTHPGDEIPCVKSVRKERFIIKIYQMLENVSIGFRIK